jgi:4-aminobutyrate aminotransferase / (S)-3-amino-2-methylpropionate transaminase / 5-aminovalerate transaminase
VTDTPEKYERYVNTSSLYPMEPVTVKSARGATLTDESGNSYVDMFSGISVANTGHGHPRVVDAAKRQLDELVHAASYVYHVPVVADLAERLAEITPGRLQKTFFANSGAEAVEGALRLARAFTGKREIIALQTSFHGRTAATLAVTGNALRKKRSGSAIPGVAFAPAPNPYRCRMCSGACTLACADAVEDVIRYETSADVAAFIAEPVLGEGGIIPLPDGYLQRVKQVLDREGALLIIDEVQTGFARSGAMFAVERHGVEPDIMTMAKGIASGLPLGAFIARPDVADAFHPGEHMSTFGGNPVSCAAALATIDVIVDERLIERAATMGSRTLEQLQTMAQQHDIIGDVRGEGLMLGLELVRDRTSKEPATQEAAAVRRACRERGVLIGVGGYFGNVVRLQPPLVIADDELERALAALENAIAGVAPVSVN